MIVLTIETTLRRAEITSKYKFINTECIQQSSYTDNDRYGFFKPMADFIAHLITNKD